MKKILLALCLSSASVFASASYEMTDKERITHELMAQVNNLNENDLAKFQDILSWLVPDVTAYEDSDEIKEVALDLLKNEQLFKMDDLKHLLKIKSDYVSVGSAFNCLMRVFENAFSFEHLKKWIPYTGDIDFIEYRAGIRDDANELILMVLAQKKLQDIEEIKCISNIITVNTCRSSYNCSGLNSDKLIPFLESTKSYTYDEFKDVLIVAISRKWDFSLDSYFLELINEYKVDSSLESSVLAMMEKNGLLNAEKLVKFITEKQCSKEEIESGEAVEWCNKNSNLNNSNYPIKRRNGIQTLCDKGAHGSGRTIAVYDNKFTRIMNVLPEQMLPLTSHYEDWETKEYFFPEEHGSRMIERILRVTPKAKIWPVNGFFSDTATVTKAFYDFGDNPDLHVINCSFELPCSHDNPYIMSAELKEAIRYCLSKNKVIVLAASNTNKAILDKPREMKEGDAIVATETLAKFTGVATQTIYESLLSSLFVDEPEDSLFFKNLIIAGESKVTLDSGEPCTVKSGTGPASKVYVCTASSGGTSFSAAMISGIVANLWSVIDDAPGSAERVVQALLETADTNDDYDPAKHGRGFANAAKALEKLMPSGGSSSS